MASSRLKWTVQTGGRVTIASTSSLAILSGKAVGFVSFALPVLLVSDVHCEYTYRHNTIQYN